MRRILAAQILTFFALSGSALVGATLLIALLHPALAWSGEFRPIIASALGVILFIVLAIATYRIKLAIAPLPEGEIELGSRDEDSYHVHLLFFLMLFYPLMKSNLLPVPLTRLLYLGLGARMGENTYSGGILFDPVFIDLGSNTLIGQGAMLIPHVIEGPRLAHHPIRIGSNVTIGANAVILADVRIEDEAIVAIGAVVPKGSRIGRGEVWGGIPARRLRAPESPDKNDQQRA